MTLAWDDERCQVLRCICAGRLDWAEISQNMEQAAAMLDGVSRPVHVFIFAEGASLPADAPFHFPSLARKSYWRHSNLAGTIVVGADNFFKMMFDIFRQVYGGPYVKVASVQTLGEAYQIVRRSAL